MSVSLEDWVHLKPPVRIIILNKINWADKINDGLFNSYHANHAILMLRLKKKKKSLVFTIKPFMPFILHALVSGTSYYCLLYCKAYRTFVFTNAKHTFTTVLFEAQVSSFTAKTVVWYCHLAAFFPLFLLV